MESNKGGEQKAVAGGRHIHAITWTVAEFWLCMGAKGWTGNLGYIQFSGYAWSTSGWSEAGFYDCFG